MTLRESIILKQTYGLSLETLLGGIGQAGMDALALLQRMSTEDQQEVYELFYRAIVLLAARRQAQQREEEQLED